MLSSEANRMSPTLVTFWAELFGAVKKYKASPPEILNKLWKGAKKVSYQTGRHHLLFKLFNTKSNNMKGNWKEYIFVIEYDLTPANHVWELWSFWNYVLWTSVILSRPMGLRKDSLSSTGFLGNFSNASSLWRLSMWANIT